MTTPLASMPKSIRRGDRVEIRIVAPEHPAPTWTVRLGLQSPDGLSSYAEAATDYGDGSHLLTLDASETAASLTPGRWIYALRAELVSDPTDRRTLDAGELEVLPDLLDNVGEARHPLEIALANVEARLAGSTSDDVLSYSIGGRSLSKHSRAELLDLHRYLSGRVAAIRADRARLLGKARPNVTRVRL